MYVTRIDSAFPSPRIVNGVIMWYAGDEFKVGFKLKLLDMDSEEVTLGEDDSVSIIIRNDRMEQVKVFEFDSVEENYVVMDFTSEVSALFPPGAYFYDIKLTGTYNTTIVKNNRMKVE